MYFQSGRELREELTGIRLAAANTSLWSIAQHIDVRARVAIDDALRTFPMPVRRVDFSVMFPADGGVVGLPEGIHRIISIEPTVVTSQFQIATYRHIPTAFTNIVEVTMHSKANNAFWVRMEYLELVDHLPEDRSVLATTSATGQEAFLVYNPEQLKLAGWPDSGYAEITCLASQGLVEAVYYTSMSRTDGFYVTGRGQLGTTPTAWAVTSSVRVSPYLMMPPEAKPVIMKAAEANMYEYWAGHRAMYDQYTAVTGIAQMDLADVLAMNRVLDDTAERRYERLKRPPVPGRAQVKRRNDLGL